MEIILKKKGGRAISNKDLYFSDFVFIESLPIIVHIKITFSNLKSVECFEFDKKILETTYTVVKKMDFNYI